MTDRPSETEPRAHLRRAGWIIAIGLVVAFLGWGIVDGWRTVADYPWRLSPGWFVLGLGALGASFLIAGLGYHGLVSRLQPPGPPVRSTLSVWGRSLLGRYVPGNVLMVLGRLELGRRIGIARPVSLSASVYEQVLGLTLAAVWGMVYLVTGFGAQHGRAIWLVAAIPVLALVLHPRVFRPLSTWALGRIKRPPLERFLSGRQVAGFAAWYAISSSLTAMGTWAVVHSAAAGSGNPIEVAGAFQLAVVLSTLAVIIPSGLGVREGVFALALSRHVGGSVALALSVGARLIITMVELAFVAIVFLLARRR